MSLLFTRICSLTNTCEHKSDKSELSGVIKELLLHGARLDDRTPDGFTALLHAAQRGHSDVDLKILLSLLTMEKKLWPAKLTRKKGR